MGALIALDGLVRQYETDDKDEDGVTAEEKNLEFVPEVVLAPPLLLPVLLGVCDTSLGVAIEKFLTVGHRRWKQGITDRDAKGGEGNQPEHRGETGVCDEVEEDVVCIVVVVECVVGGKGDSREDEHDVK